jgi:hypothetical protein
MVSQYNNFKTIYFMRLLFFYFSSVFFMLDSCNSITLLSINSSVKGNRVIIEKDIAVSDYSEIHLGVLGEIVYRQMQDSTPSFRISTDENILPLLDIAVEGTCLKIKSKNRKNIRPSRLIVYTGSADLNRLKVVGSGKVRLCEKITSDRMNILVDGSGDIASDDLSCKDMAINISGWGSIRLKGSGERVSFSISGSGNVHAFDFAAREMTCKILGAGNMDVHAREKLTASIKGSGSIRYMGNPQTNNTINGWGSIKRKQQ